MNNGITSLKQIGHSRAELLIFAHPHGSTNRNDISADCALLRSCVWSLSCSSSSSSTPVHILRVLNQALRMWDSAQEAQQRRERLHIALEELSNAGDLVSLPEGNWLPAPTREVLLETGTNERLLVGGLPTGVLTTELKGLIYHHGPYRRVRGPALGEALGLAKESLRSWTKSPLENLETWATELLNIKLSPYSEPNEGLPIRVYAPELAKDGYFQAKRWTDCPGSISGRYLAARQRVFGIHEYRIVELKEGAIVAMDDSLAPGDGRRLMYALDARAGRPVEIRVGSKDESLSVTLHNELPRSEQRLFGALGSLEVPDEGYYPRTWWFAEYYRDLILSRLQTLRVRIVES